MNNLNIGLHIIASQVSFEISICAVEKDINSIQLTQEASVFMYCLLECFSIVTEDDDGTTKLTINPIQQYTEEIKSKLDEFINNYKKFMPQLMAMEQKAKKLKIGEYIFVTGSNIQIDTEQTIEIYNKLKELNGDNNDLSVPLLKEYNMFPYGDKPHTNIGHRVKNSRVCRWCGSTNKNATFNNKAHAVTEALGNKNLVLFDECDICNKKFGEGIEQSIIAIFSLFNTFWGVIGKNGVPKINYYSEKTNEKGVVTKDITKVENLKENQISVSLSEHYIDVKNGKPVSAKIKVAEKYVAQDVYRSLCKYALSLVENDNVLPCFKELIDWINKKEDINKLPIVKVLNSYQFFPKQPIVNLYIRKTENEQLPFMFAEFQYKNFILIFIIPKDNAEIEKFLNTENYNNFWKTTFYNDINGWKDWDFSDNNPKELIYNVKFEQR